MGSGHGYSVTPEALAEYRRLARTWGPEQDTALARAQDSRGGRRWMIARPQEPPQSSQLPPSRSRPTDIAAEQQLLAVALRGEVRPAHLELDPRWFSSPLHRAAWAWLLVLDEDPQRATHDPVWFAAGGRPLVRLGVLVPLVIDLVGMQLQPARVRGVSIYLAWHRAHGTSEGYQQSAARVRELHRRRWMVARLQGLIGGWLWDEPAPGEVLEQTAARLREMAVDTSV
jgi:hypothetical protein